MRGHSAIFTREGIPDNQIVPPSIAQFQPTMLRTMFLSLALALPAFAQGWLRQNEFIFESAPFPECHASTIVETRDGALLAAWFGGTREKHVDVGIWISRRDKDGWSKPMEVANGLYPDGRRYPCWNPVLFQPREGPLMLFYKVGPSPSSWWGMLKTSEDAGKTWSTPRQLEKGFLGPIKNKPVQLENGDILSPSSTEHDGWRVHFERSSDLGKTWKSIEPVNDGKKIGAIQPSILRHRAGRLQAIGRTEQRRVFTTESSDAGQSWSAMRLLTLPNPNAGTDALTLADGRHLIVYNHTSKGRTPLNVAVSSDGERWQAAAVLEREPGEYSYPAVIQTKDGLVHITYTWKRQRVRHVVVDPAKLEPQDLRNGEWPADVK